MQAGAGEGAPAAQALRGLRGGSRRGDLVLLKGLLFFVVDGFVVAVVDIVVLSKA